MSLTDHVGGRRVGVASVLLVVGFAVAVWLVGGVGAVDVALHLGYLAVVVVGPGVLLVRLLTGSRDPIVVLGVGWAAGMALEVLGVVLTAALGVRSLAPVLPLAIAGAAWWPGRRTRLRWPAPRPAPWAAFAMSGAGVAVLLLSVGRLFPSTPLPGVVTSITYDHDTLFYLGIAADALHHWPPTNPSIAGPDLPYHLWAFARQAGEARATGIDLPVVAFRLDTSTTAMALVLAVAALARTAGAGAFGSGLAALLAIVTTTALRIRQSLSRGNCS